MSVKRQIVSSFFALTSRYFLKETELLISNWYRKAYSPKCVSLLPLDLIRCIYDFRKFTPIFDVFDKQFISVEYNKNNTIITSNKNINLNGINIKTIYTKRSISIYNTLSVRINNSSNYNSKIGIVKIYGSIFRQEFIDGFFGISNDLQSIVKSVDNHTDRKICYFPSYSKGDIIRIEILSKSFVTFDKNKTHACKIKTKEFTTNCCHFALTFYCKKNAKFEIL